MQMIQLHSTTLSIIQYDKTTWSKWYLSRTYLTQRVILSWIFTVFNCNLKTNNSSITIIYLESLEDQKKSSLIDPVLLQEEI
jgi:hypothetical protein